MASATATFSQLSANSKVVHTGIIATGGALSAATTICPSTVLAMVEVPSGATLVDFWIRIQNAADDDQQSIQIGTSNTPSGIMAITTITQTYSFSASSSLDVLTLNIIGDANHGAIRCPGGTRGATGATTNLMPVRISLSDDVTPAKVWVQGRLGGGVSASAFFTFMLFYTMDGLAGRTIIR